MERRGDGGVNRLLGIIEPAMTVGSAIAAEVPALAVGLGSLNTVEDRLKPFSEAVTAADEVREMLTYNPRSMEGQAGMQSLINSVSQLADTVGLDKAFQVLNEEIIPRVQSTLGKDAAIELGSMVMMIPAVRRVTKGIDAFHGSGEDFPPVAEIKDKTTGKSYYVKSDSNDSWKNHPAVKLNPEKFEKINFHPLGHFDSSFIGRGEGNQVFGRGLYLAGEPEVGEIYQQAMASKFGLDHKIEGGGTLSKTVKNFIDRRGLKETKEYYLKLVGTLLVKDKKLYNSLADALYIEFDFDRNKKLSENIKLPKHVTFIEEWLAANQ